MNTDLGEGYLPVLKYHILTENAIEMACLIHSVSSRQISFMKITKCHDKASISKRHLHLFIEPIATFSQ